MFNNIFIDIRQALKFVVYSAQDFLLVLAVLFLPIYPAIFIISLFIVLSQDKRYKYFIFLLLLSFLVILNTNRSVDNDLQNYLSVFNYMNNSSLRDFFEDSNQFMISLRLSEIFWYITTWTVSNISEANEIVYITFLTCSIYGIYYIGLKDLIVTIDGNTQLSVMTILFGTLVCINFSETTHLIRQYICGSILFLQFVWIFRKQYVKVLMLFVPAVLIHNSLLVPFFFILLTVLIFTQSIFTNKIVRIFLIPVMTGALLGFVLNSFVSRLGYESSDSSDGVFMSMALDVGAYFSTLGFFLYSRNRKPLNGLVEFYLIFFLSFAAFLFLLRSSVLVYLRFYLYLEWFRVFGLISLTSVFPFLMRSSFGFFLFIVLCFLFVQLRILKAPWEYEVGLVHLMSINFFQLIKLFFNNIIY